MPKAGHETLQQINDWTDSVPAHTRISVSTDNTFEFDEDGGSAFPSGLFENDALDFVPDVVETVDDGFEVIVDLLPGDESHRV